MTAPPPGRSGGPGRVVPVYAVTGGRTRSTGRVLPLESLVSATGRAARVTGLEAEYRAVVALAQDPVSVVEIGAHLGVPVGVARVLVSDLADAGYLVVHAPGPQDADGRPAPEVLERLLAGLRTH